MSAQDNTGNNHNKVGGGIRDDRRRAGKKARWNAGSSIGNGDQRPALGGPSWTVPLGQRDARTASRSDANSQIPSPFSSLATLTSMFGVKGLNARDMIALSGAHTIGQAQCFTFRSRIYNDTKFDLNFATTRKATRPYTGGNSNLAPLDIQTPNRFGNNYYQNLVAKRGLLHSDQELFNNGPQDALVRTYSSNNEAFYNDFAAAMVKMGNISPLTGINGEIRRN
ncbi:hypothetical protein RJ639_023914 [Escallonia herrerae]|uniref:peroxidase n=1 Tax=Escallonia herrerae TaxID=1293975 RepID=A0AA88V3D8_9ASTE|nr:hypothetical protein RJ639_023914 [Escallonia herrerae]